MYDIRLLTLLKLVEIKNYTKTAKELNFTQPTVTQHIKSLEKEYNIKIFAKGLTLTNAGNMLYEYAKQVSYNHNLFLTNVNNLIQLEKKINLGMSDNIYYFLSDTNFFSDLLKNSKNRVGIEILNNHDIIDNLLLAKVDFAFSSMKDENPDIIREEIYLDELVLAVRKDHLLTKKESSMKKYYLVIPNNTNPYYDSLDKYLSDNDFIDSNFKNVIETSSLDFNLNMVLKHNAVGVFYKSNILKYIKNHELVILKDTNIEIPIYYLRNKINYDNIKLSYIKALLDKIREI